QLEQVLEEGSKRPILIKFLPLQRHLYSNCRVNSPQDTSAIEPASLWFLAMPLIFRFSIQIVSIWLSLTILVESLCKKSFLTLVIFSYCLATFRFAFLRFCEPFFFLEALLCSTFSLLKPPFSGLGASTLVPSEKVANEVIPKSIPN